MRAFSARRLRGCLSLIANPANARSRQVWRMGHVSALQYLLCKMVPEFRTKDGRAARAVAFDGGPLCRPPLPLPSHGDGQLTLK